MSETKPKRVVDVPKIDLSPHIDDIIDAITAGETYKKIAEKYKCSSTTLYNFLLKEEYSARAKDARALAASSYYDLAELSLKEAKSTMPEITRARELAQFYMKKAGKVNPKEYGDKIEVENSGILTVKNVSFD